MLANSMPDPADDFAEWSDDGAPSMGTSFDRVIVDGGMDLTIEVGDQTLVPSRKDVVAAVRGKTLILTGDASNDTPLCITAIGPVLNVDHRGTGTVELQISKLPRLLVQSSGGGSIRGSGRVSTLEARNLGAGPIDLAELDAAHAWLTVEGAGPITARVRATVRIDKLGTGRLLLNPHLPPAPKPAVTKPRTRR